MRERRGAHTHTLPGDLRGPQRTMVGYWTQGQGVAPLTQQDLSGLCVCTQWDSSAPNDSFPKQLECELSGPTERAEWKDLGSFCFILRRDKNR